MVKEQILKGTINGGFCFDLSEAKAKDRDTQTLTISRYETAKFKLGFDFKLLQTKISVNVEMTSFSEKELVYSLPSLYKYTAFKLANDFGYSWSVE